MSRHTGFAVLALLAVLLGLGVTLGVSAAPVKDGAQTLYEQARELSHPRHMGAQSTEALNLLAKALEQDPQHVPSLNYRANLLIELDRFEEAVVDLQRLVEVTKLADAELTLCMVRDYLDGNTSIPVNCYLNAARRFSEKSEGAPQLNYGYLLSLKMAGAPEFESALEAALTEQGRDEKIWGPGLVNLEVLQEDRDELLLEFLGFKNDPRPEASPKQ